MDEAGFSQILDSVYAAAATYTLWPEALERLGEIFGCSCVSLIDRDQRTLASDGTAWGVDLEGQQEYFAVWGARNPIVHRKTAWRAGEIDTDRQILPKNDLVATDYYNAFMKPRDMHAILRLTLNTGGRAGSFYHQVLNFARPMGGGDFESQDIGIARRLMPHLQRAGHITWRLKSAQVMLDGVTEMLERNPAGILLVDRLGKIVFANGALRKMAQADNTFALRRDRIEALDRRDNTALQSLIARAISASPALDTVRAGAMRFTRESGKAGFNVVVAPLANPQVWSEGAPVAFVLVSEPGTATALQSGVLAQLFDFSPAEVRVAERLIAGDTPEQAAAALDIRVSTARWHLASLFRKTGTSRQAELVRLLLSLPTLRLS